MISTLKNWIRSLFKKKVRIYTAFGHDDYFKVIAKLSAGGLLYMTKSPITARSRDVFTESNQQYDIYVYQEEEHKAIEALHRKEN